MIETRIPDDFLTLCSNWSGGTDCMLYAISSTGNLTMGSIRPYNDDSNRPMTDEEWHVNLFSSLRYDLRYNVQLAKYKNSDDLDELRKFLDWTDKMIERLEKEYGLNGGEND